MKSTNLFSGHGADVVVQAQHLDARDLLDHCFHDRPRRFDQMGPYLFEQVPPLLGDERLDQLLFSRGQDALEADHEEITDQVGDVLFSCWRFNCGRTTSRSLRI